MVPVLECVLVCTVSNLVVCFSCIDPRDHCDISSPAVICLTIAKLLVWSQKNVDQ